MLLSGMLMWMQKCGMSSRKKRTAEGTVTALKAESGVRTIYCKHWASLGIHINRILRTGDYDGSHKAYRITHPQAMV